MATTVATAATLVATRLNLQTSSSAMSMTPAQLQTEIIDAFRYHFGILRPVFHGTSTLTSSLVSGTISDMAMPLYVEVNRIMLFRNEWTESGDTVEIAPMQYARSGDGINVWYTKDDNLSAPSTIDSDCIHGADWLESVSLLKAEIEALVRLAATADTGIATFNMQKARSIEQRYNEMIKNMHMARDRDVATLEARLQDRRVYGPHPFVISPLAGFDHQGLIRNDTTGIP